ncbi:hypothetical protein [Prosthecobacter vanneervenii]|uniref:Uncharacterized protein n=1 Tax=Prosthecobacter vanneervenii TaxID=48466 RepID=A0A7W7YGA4_9BACT|nr:hypothetical protein [Prosthecobacter vanneervenii]MBB5035656.1 hypothetical protein [Prosthecobacter vanneervenii]
MEKKAVAYAGSRQAELSDSLGFGVDGSVWLLHSKERIQPWAAKLFRADKAYCRERDCYLRLREQNVENVRGFAVPAYLHHDDAWLVVEMTIVRPPYLLDFAGALLDEPFDFHEETWEAWEMDRMEKFEDRWPEVKKVMIELEYHGIFLSDLHPGNIAFE